MSENEPLKVASGGSQGTVLPKEEVTETKKGQVFSFVKNAFKEFIPGIIKSFKYKQISNKELSLMYYQFSTMLLAGLSFRGAMRSLQQTSSKLLGEIIRKIANKVEGGHTLSQAMSEHPRIFSNLDLGIVFFGEQIGEIGGALKRLALHHERIARVQSEITRVLTYPIFVLSVAFISVVVIFTYFIPQFKRIYDDLHIELPKLTKIMFSGVEWMVSPPGYITITVVVLIVIPLLQAFLKTPEGTYIKDAFLLSCPVIQRPFRAAALTDFFRTFATLIESGIPIAKVLQIQTLATGNQILKKHLEETQIELVRGYAKLSDLLRHYIFPPVVQQMFVTVEETGEYNKVLTRMAEMYEVELNTSMEQCVQVATPLLFMIIGIIVGVVLISIMTPIYSLMSQFGH